MTDKEAFESSLPKEINIYLQDGSVLDNENVVEDSMVWTTTLCDEDYITIGKCCPSSFEIMIFSDANYPAKKTRINPIIKVTDEDNITHEMDLGLYYVYSSSRTDDKLHRDIVAYDYFYSLSVLPINDFINRFFEETTIYSFTFKELRTSFYKEFGIIDDTPEEMYVYDDYVIGTGFAEIENKLKEINCSARDLLQSICELHGTFGRINKSGHFMMVNSANIQTGKNIEKNDYNMGGIEYEDYSMANVSTITFTGTQFGKNISGKYSSGISGSTYTVSNNIFTLGNGEKWLRQAAETFFNSASAFLKSYVPAKITGRYIHDISVGDIISVECADETIKSYVFKKTVTGIPFLNQKIESSGSEEYSSVVNLSNINLGGLSQQEISLLQNSQSVSALQAELIVVKSEVADKITVNDLTAENLKAGVATIDSITATDAFIQNIFSQEIIGNEAILSNLQAIIINAEYIKTAIADVGYITADEADIKYATIEKLNAQTARIEDLETTALTANSAIIVELNAGIADINTLIFGSATGTVIQTEFANSVIAQLGDAQIKSAMIESVSAGKITAGTIYTDDVTIRSKSGNMILSDNTIQISDGTNVRVQIGKDASNDYSINIWDSDGNLMFSQGGITDSAIKSAIIRNDMVSETANISASKLDIDSLFTVINEDNSHTLKSTKIYLDDEGQTLDVVFKELSTSVTEQGEAISSQGTQISTIQGQITSKIWQQDITTATTPLENSITTLNTQYSSLLQDLSGFKTTVSQTYATTSSVNEQVSNLQQQIDGAIETYTGTAEPTLTNYPTNEWTTDTEKDTHIGDLYIVNSSGGDKAGFYYRFEKVGTTYRWTLLKDSEVTKALQDAKEANEKAQAVADDLSANYSTTTQMNSAITQKANEITTTVSATYTTKEEFNGLEIGGRNLLLNSGDLTKWTIENGVSVVKDSGGWFKVIDTHVSERWGIYFDVANYEQNTDYTLSVDVKYGNANTSVSQGYGNFGSNIQTITSGSKRIKMTFNTGNNTRAIRVYLNIYPTAANQYGFFKLPKLELGNKATDWTPAPEDTEEKITELNTKYTEVKQTTDGLSATVASHTTQIAGKAENSTVTAVNDKVTALTVDLSGFKTTVSSTYTTKEEFNGLEIGGRNLFLNTGITRTNNSYNVATYIPASEYLVAGEIYTVSICVTPAENVGSIKLYFSNGWENVATLRTNGTTKQIITKTFVMSYYSGKEPSSNNQSHAYAYFYRFPNDGTVTGNTTIHWVKIEKGNKATDWTPAPEDVDSEINEVSTKYEQLSDKFSWVVKSGTSETDFTLTDRTATLVSDYINLNGLVTFNGLDRNTQTEIEKAQGIINNIYTTNTTTIDGGKITTGSITADKINVADLFAQDITATNISIEGGRIGGFEITENQLSVLDPNDDYKYVGSFYSGIQRGVAGGLYGNISISAPFVNIYSTDLDGEFDGNVNINGVEIGNDPNTGTYISTDNIYVDGRTVVKSYGDGTTTHIIDQMTHVYVGQNNHIAFNTAKGAFGVTAWVSDTKLKKNIIGTEINALDKINQINMVQFDWKRGGHVDLGVSANQLSEIIPDAVFEVEQEENSEFDSLKNVNPSVLISYCIKAIQELSEENKKLKKEV